MPSPRCGQAGVRDPVADPCYPCVALVVVVCVSPCVRCSVCFVKKEKCPSEVTTGDYELHLLVQSHNPKKEPALFQRQIVDVINFKITVCVCVMDKEYKKTFNVINL